MAEGVRERALRKIFGSERDEAIRYWRRLHNEELHNLYSPNVIRLIKLRRMRWAGHVAHMGERIGAYRVVVGKTEGEIPLRRPTRKWEDNIKMDVKSKLDELEINSKIKKCQTCIGRY